MKMGVLAGAAALAVTGFASAAFVGTDVQSSIINGKTVFKVYAVFNSASDVVLNVFGVNNITGAFFQSDFVGGSWAPQFTNPADVLTDSFVTVGGLPGFANSTNADPGWGGPGFNQPGIPAGAGWFNSNPPNLQGKVDPVTLKTFIAQFSYAGAIDAFTTPVQIGYNQGIGTVTQFGTGSFSVPAPGAIALLGLAGLAGRRRRA
jgi:MYXO-CTERM domain-containing protein